MKPIGIRPGKKFGRRRGNRWKCSVLPVLTTFWFKGVTEYLEDLVACIDAPQLNSLGITFFSDIVFDTPQLVQFINRTPVSEALEKARIVFMSSGEGLMQRAGSANFISRAALYLVLASSFYVAGPLHLRVRRRLDRQHREHPMVGTITPIYCCEESLLIRGLCITYRACPQRARSRQNDSGVACPCRISSWRSSSHLDQSGKALDSLLLRDSLPVTL